MTEPLQTEPLSARRRMLILVAMTGSLSMIMMDTTVVGVALAVALDRSKAVGSVRPGVLEVLHHRRVAPFFGAGSTVVLDDTDRVGTTMWVAVGAEPSVV